MAQLLKVLLVGRNQATAKALTELSPNHKYQFTDTVTNPIWWLFDGEMHMYAGKQDIGEFDIIITCFREKSILISKYIATAQPKPRATVVNSRENEYSTSKQVQYLDLYRAGLSFPKTICAHSVKNLEEILRGNDRFKFPLIVKSNTDCQGKDNYLFKSWQQMANFFAQNDAQDYIIQEYIPNSFDYRVFIFGENYCVSKKVRLAGEGHRNNVALGAVESIVSDLDPVIIKDCFAAVKSAGVSLAGVDVVVDEQSGKHYILEVNVNNPGITLNQNETHEVKVLFKSISQLLERN